MATTRVSGQIAKGNGDAAATVSAAYPSDVTAGNLLVIAVGRYNGAPSNPIVVGDISKTGGCTLGTFTLDYSYEYQPTANNYHNLAIFSVPVAVGGGGSCTITVGGGTTSDYWTMGVIEYTGSDVSSSRIGGTPTGAQGSGTAAATGNVVSGTGGVFVGAVAIDAIADGTITPDPTFTEIVEEEQGLTQYVFSMIDRIVSVDTTDEATWTIMNRPWNAGLVFYKEGAAATTISLPGYRA